MISRLSRAFLGSLRPDIVAGERQKGVGGLRSRQTDRRRRRTSCMNYSRVISKRASTRDRNDRWALPRFGVLRLVIPQHDLSRTKEMSYCKILLSVRLSSAQKICTSQNSNILIFTTSVTKSRMHSMRICKTDEDESYVRNRSYNSPAWRKRIKINHQNWLSNNRLIYR